MANLEVLALDTVTPQIRAPGAGDGYSVPRDMTFSSGTTLSVPTVDATNVEVTNVKAKDGTAAITIADSTGAVTASSTVSATKLIPTGNVTAGNGMYLPAADTLAWSTGGSERMRLDTSGNLGIGTSSPFTTLDVNGHSTAGVRNTTNISLATGTHYFGSSPSDLIRNNIVGNINTDSSTPVRLRFYKSRGTSASPTAVSSGDQTNDIQTYAYDGSSFIQATSIKAVVTATPSTNNVSSELSFSTNGGSSSPSERMRIDSSGNVGIGAPGAANEKVSVRGTLPTSSAFSFSYVNQGTVPSGTTQLAVGFYSAGTTQATSFTLSSYQHFRAWQGGFGAGSTVTNQYGFSAESTLTGATNNYGFYSNIASGANRWNFYAAGTARNYFAGGLEVVAGTTTMTSGFTHIPAAAGAPTGVVTNPTGNVAMYYDTTNNKIYVYNGGWKQTAALT